MEQKRLRASQALGIALGILVFEAVRRQLRSDTWDYGLSDTVSADRAVVAVSFSRDELEVVSRSAELARAPTSQFIRDAALARAQSPP